MATPPRLKSVTKPSKEFREKLQQRAGITHWAEDSVAKNLSDVLSSAIVANQNQTASAFEEMQISTASGKALEALARTHGQRRILPARAYSPTQERSFYFYANGETFGDLNSGSSITIPAGTVITPTSTGGSQIQYIVKYTYTLPAGESKMYCAVEAVGVGSNQNVGPRVLNSHALESSYPRLYCTNNYAILNGRDLESIEDLRFRLLSYFKSLVVNGYSNLRMEALSVPGVLEVVSIEGYYGMGTCGVFVFGADGFSSPELISQVQRKLNSIATPGLRVIVSPGVQVSFIFDLELVVPTQPTSAQQARIRSGIKRVMREYFATSSVRKRVSLAELRRTIISEVSEFASIVPRKYRTQEDVFTNSYVSRKYATYLNGSERERIINNSYSLSREEYAALGSVNITFQVVE